MRKFLYLIIFLVLIGGVGVTLNELRKSPSETIKRVKEVVEEIVQEPEKAMENVPDEIQEEALAEQEEIFEELDAEFESETEKEIVPQNDNGKLTTDQALAIIRALKGDADEKR